MSVQFRSITLGDYVIRIDTIRNIIYHNYAHIEIEYGCNCRLDLYKDNFIFTDWDAFVRNLSMVFEL